MSLDLQRLCSAEKYFATKTFENSGIPLEASHFIGYFITPSASAYPADRREWDDALERWHQLASTTVNDLSAFFAVTTKISLSGTLGTVVFYLNGIKDGKMDCQAEGE
jgi:hypothetical protein